MFTLTLRNLFSNLALSNTLSYRGMITIRNISGIYEEDKSSEEDELEYLNQQSILHANSITLETYNDLKNNINLYVKPTDTKMRKEQSKYEGFLL